MNQQIGNVFSNHGHICLVLAKGDYSPDPSNVPIGFPHIEFQTPISDVSDGGFASEKFLRWSLGGAHAHEH